MILIFGIPTIDNTKTEVVTEKIEYKDVIKLKYRDPDCLDD